jgi:hypothetical protein
MSSNDVVLSEEPQLELSRIAQSRSLPAGYVFRARLILMLAEGAPFSTIKQRLRTSFVGSGASSPLASTVWIRIIRDKGPQC